MSWYRQLLTMSTYEKTCGLILPGRGVPVRWADEKHHELKSFGLFLYQEIRDFLNSKRAVFRKSFFLYRQSEAENVKYCYE
jgi:hypothetical protein